MNQIIRNINDENDYSSKDVRKLSEVLKQDMPEFYKLLEQDESQKRRKAQLEIFKSEGVA